MTATIRSAVAEDAPHLVALLCYQMAEHSLPASAKDITRAVARVFDSPALGSFLVAVDGAELVGVAYVALLHSMEHAGTVPLLEELYVLPAHRGRGVGSALLRRAVEQFSTLPGKPMELEVDATHQRAEAFYQRHGFTLRRRSRWIHVPPAGSGVS